MEQWEPPAWGTVRINNPITLQAWIDKGWYQRQLDDGWIFNTGCGRFKREVCTCHKCRKTNRISLKEVLIKNGYHEKTS